MVAEKNTKSSLSPSKSVRATPADKADAHVHLLPKEVRAAQAVWQGSGVPTWHGQPGRIRAKTRGHEGKKGRDVFVIQAIAVCFRDRVS